MLFEEAMSQFMMYMFFQCLGDEKREVLVVLDVEQLEGAVRNLLVDLKVASSRVLVAVVVEHVPRNEVSSDVVHLGSDEDVERYLLVVEVAEE
jgi:hypothetical protein